MKKKNQSRSKIIKRRAVPTKRSLLLRILRWLLLLSVTAVVLAAAAAVGLYFYMSRDLPRISSLADYRPSIITTVYSDDQRKIGEFYKERRIVVPLEELPKTLLQAFVAAEDARFYKHRGVDLVSIVRAFFKNLEAGTIVQGGSTITQQVTKSFFLTPERSYTRKIKEAILAYRIDQRFSKDEILFLYLNQIYLGHGAYGVQAAAENYFGKTVKELNLAECAILAGLPQAPSKYSPFRHPKRAKQRQIYVLNRMVEEGYIDNPQSAEAIKTEMDIKPRRNWYIEQVPIYTEHVRRYVEKKYGPEILYRQGLQIHTAVNIEMQKIARQEVLKGLQDLDKRRGYRGPTDRLPQEGIEAFSKQLQTELDKTPLEVGHSVQAVVVDVDDAAGQATVRMGRSVGILPIANMRWARQPNDEVAYYEARITKPSQALKVGDVVLVKAYGRKEGKDKAVTWQLALEQKPDVQSALLCLEVETGQVKVMVGGRDFHESQFNRAIQSRRQPGSAFKPLIYAAAIDKGYTPATVVIDSPIVFKDTERDFVWKPKNYKKKFFGPTLMREALAKSRNVVTIKIMRDIGIDYTIEYARSIGITSPMSRDLSIALGSSGVSLLEITNAYSVFANQGYLIEPVFITKIVDREGNVLEEASTVRKKVIEKSTAYIMTSMLESVVKNGTGWRIRALKRPAAGKTGTTNNLHDAWFVGYTPRYVTATWVGFDEEKPLGKSETGSRAASPIWLGFMQRILEEKPVRVFQVPESVVFCKIDAESGLLPIETSAKTLFECFKEGTAPTEHTPRPDTVTEQGDFFKSDL